MAPLPSADARHWWSPAAMSTAPRLWALLPEVTVQRLSWIVAGDASGIGVTSVAWRWDWPSPIASRSSVRS